jgi:hypothetical protein
MRFIASLEYFRFGNQPSVLMFNFSPLCSVFGNFLFQNTQKTEPIWGYPLTIRLVDLQNEGHGVSKDSIFCHGQWHVTIPIWGSFATRFFHVIGV